MARKQFEIYPEKHLGSLTNTNLLGLAEKHKKQPAILEDILLVLKPRKNDKAIETRAFIVPILKWYRLRRRIFGSLAILVGAIAIGMFQGVGRELWGHYGTMITDLVASLSGQ